jgi:endonuclease YncB( thermonuclease family)
MPHPSPRRPLPRWRTCLPACILILAFHVVPAVAGERLGGPVSATILRVVDGDTLHVEAAIWIGQRITVNVRIRGIDTPELRGDCHREKAMAEAAKSELARLTRTGAIQLRDIENDKYAGRVLADVETAAGIDVAAHLLATGHARAYDGGGRGGWCAIAGLRE